MHLHRLRDAFCRDLRRPLTAQRLHDATSGEPTLRPLRTPDAMITLLHDRNLPIGERNAVLAALLRTAQRMRVPEVSTLLIVAFHPGLVNLCCHLRALAPKAHDSSLAMLVLESFLETVHTFPVETQAHSSTIGLLFGTRRLVLSELHQLKRARLRHPAPLDGQRDVPSRTADPEAVLVCREVAREATFSALTEHLRVAGLFPNSSAEWIDLSDAMECARRSPRATRTEQEQREYKRAQRARHRVLHGKNIETARDRLSSIREHLPLLQQEGWQ